MRRMRADPGPRAGRKEIRASRSTPREGSRAARYYAMRGTAPGETGGSRLARRRQPHGQAARHPVRSRRARRSRHADAASGCSAANRLTAALLPSPFPEGEPNAPAACAAMGIAPSNTAQAPAAWRASPLPPKPPPSKTTNGEPRPLSGAGRKS
jgi:hypothetical protein